MTKYKLRIRDLREDNDLRQREIAEYLNISQVTYSNYEINKRAIPLDILISLAKFYNVSLDYICGISNDKD